MVVAAVDPGREKCGLAVVTDDGRALWQAVVETARLKEEMAAAVRDYAPVRLLIGSGTTSRAARAALRAAFPALPITIVDEYRTTDDARRAYWQAHPPTGWRRFVPTGMQTPPVPVDDFAAVILARRYLSARASENLP